MRERMRERTIERIRREGEFFAGGVKCNRVHFCNI